MHCAKPGAYQNDIARMLLKPKPMEEISAGRSLVSSKG
jgi:hypothetical protein